MGDLEKLEIESKKFNLYSFGKLMLKNYYVSVSILKISLCCV